MLLSKLQLLIAEEEKKRAEDGLASMHEVNRSAFLLLRLSIENTQ